VAVLFVQFPAFEQTPLVESVYPEAHPRQTEVDEQLLHPEPHAVHVKLTAD